MEQIADFEFPFVEPLPKRGKSRWEKVADVWDAFKAHSKETGGVVPVTMAAELGGVSHQRILQLLETGPLVRVELNSHVYVGEDSLVEWLKSERKSGRPSKLPLTVREQWKLARKVGDEWGKNFKKDLAKEVEKFNPELAKEIVK